MKKLQEIIHEQNGQALLEVPMTLFVVCIITLIVLQLGIWFHGYLLINTISADLCRIVAVDNKVSAEVLTSYANDRMQTLGFGVARRIPGSLTVSVQGDKRTSLTVIVTIQQQPLPLIRTISAGLVPKTVEIVGTSVTQGTFHNVEGEPSSAPTSYGNTTQ
jgi:hypothetical protein